MTLFRVAEEVNQLVPELVAKLDADIGGTPATKSWPDYGYNSVRKL